ncbi:SemiSWEET family transporter [Legionella gresilensis]|uniref:SemiSWEET family transporter n=1 Tax=Legionella gresilensis TaxID=91823 RepID=UPI001041A297|nr:SemiSWEET family transporter [Legionella gresilensis]
MSTNLLLIVATVLLTASFLPLLVKIIKNKNSQGVSPVMMLMGSTQSLLFIIYDIYFERYIMVFPFLTIGLLFFISFIVIKRYAKQGEQ